jgi:hypothetical protein
MNKEDIKAMIREAFGFAEAGPKPSSLPPQAIKKEAEGQSEEKGDKNYDELNDKQKKKVQTLTKKIKNDVARLDHYRSIKDPTWPMVHTIKELDQLPNEILREVSIDYDKVINNVVDVPDQLTQLTHTLIDKVNSSYEIIKWHLDYYQKYPVEFSQDDQIIDIDHGVYEFSILMKTELNLYQSEIFDQVWDKING